MIEVATALATLIGQLFPLIVKASQARKEDHVKIIADSEAAWSSYMAAMDSFRASIDSNDSQIDDEITKIEKGPVAPTSG